MGFHGIVPDRWNGAMMFDHVNDSVKETYHVADIVSVVHLQFVRVFCGYKCIS